MTFENFTFENLTFENLTFTNMTFDKTRKVYESEVHLDKSVTHVMEASSTKCFRYIIYESGISFTPKKLLL